MAAITATLTKRTEFAGKSKLHVITVTPTSASDTIDVSSIVGTIDALIGPPHITAGNDAALQTASATFSGTTITLVTQAAAGTAATDWTGASVQIAFSGSNP